MFMRRSLCSLIIFCGFYFAASASMAAAPRSQVLIDGDFRVMQFVVPGFENLPLQRKLYVYYLSQALEASHNIDWYQNTADGYRIRNLLDFIWPHRDLLSADLKRDLTEYAFKLYSNHGNYEDYSNRKFVPARLTATDFSRILEKLATKRNTAAEFFLAENESLKADIFDSQYRSAFHGTGDLIANSASGMYGPGLTAALFETLPKEEREHFMAYPHLDAQGQPRVSMRTTAGQFGPEMQAAVDFMKLAKKYATPKEAEVITAYRRFFETGNMADLHTAEVLWTKNQGEIDFMLNFIEVYADPLAQRGAWGGFIFLRAIDPETASRNQNTRKNADYFEARMPVDEVFKKAPGFTPPQTEGAYFIAAAGANGDSPFLGVNLPNDVTIREVHGSKSYTALNVAFDLNGPVAEKKTVAKFHPMYAEKLGTFNANLSQVLEVEFHEILGHGSGRYLDGKSDKDSKDYHSPLEETRAEVAALYHMTDPNLVEAGIVPKMSSENLHDFAQLGIITFFTNQLWSYRKLSDDASDIRQAHQWARQLMLNWMLDHHALEIVTRDNGLPVVVMNDLEKARRTLGELWAVIQRYTSEGLYEEPKRLLTERGGYDDRHRGWRAAILEYLKHSPEPSKRIFLNPSLQLVGAAVGKITDVTINYYSPEMTLEDVVTKQVRRSRAQKNLLRDRKSCSAALLPSPVQN